MWFELNHDHRAGACGGTWRIGVLAGRVGAEDVKEICMRPRSPHCLSAALAVCVLLPAAAQAQIIPFAGNFGQGLAPSDNQKIFESVARLNAVEPSKVGQSDSWSNPETKSSGSSTILRVFHSGGMACHLVRHQIVAGRPPARDYRFTWCRTPTGEWKIKS
jgi:surface antigen